MVVRAVEAVGSTTGVEENWVDIRLGWIGDMGARTCWTRGRVRFSLSFPTFSSVAAFGRRVRPSAVMGVSVLSFLRVVVQAL